jgi:hypothetical protein
VLFTGMCMALAGTIWAVNSQARKSAAGCALGVLVLIAINYSGKLFDIVYAKGKFRDPAMVSGILVEITGNPETIRLGLGSRIVDENRRGC